jgi:hypothetical protein
MVVLLSTTIISCTQAINLINRLSSVVGLTDLQRKEIVTEIKKVVPSCPVFIIKKEK